MESTDTQHLSRYKVVTGDRITEPQGRTETLSSVWRRMHGPESRFRTQSVRNALRDRGTEAYGEAKRGVPWFVPAGYSEDGSRKDKDIRYNGLYGFDYDGLSAHEVLGLKAILAAIPSVLMWGTSLSGNGGWSVVRGPVADGEVEYRLFWKALTAWLTVQGVPCVGDAHNCNPGRARFLAWDQNAGTKEVEAVSRSELAPYCPEPPGKGRSVVSQTDHMSWLKEHVDRHSVLSRPSSEGRRNGETHKRACLLWMGGYDEGTIVAEVTPLAGGMPDWEIRKAVRSARNTVGTQRLRKTVQNWEPTPAVQQTATPAAAPSEKITFLERGYRLNSQHEPIASSAFNVEIALQEMGVTVSYDVNTQTLSIDGENHHVEKKVAEMLLLCSTKLGWDPNPATFNRTLTAVAQRHDPLREFVEGLPAWDGVQRGLDTYLTLEGAHEDLHAVQLRHWFAAMIGRIMRPGAKWDACLVLYGPGGIGKDLWLESLCPAHVISKTPSIADSWQRIYSVRGKCLAVFSEGEGLLDQRLTLQKAYLENATDVYALKYQSETAYPRRHVCAVTTNRPDVLRDTTGNRRYFVLPVSEVDREALARDRDQLWAQAVAEGLWRTDEGLALPERWWDENLANAERYRERTIYETLLEPIVQSQTHLSWAWESDVVTALQVLTGYKDVKQGRVAANLGVSQRQSVRDMRDAMIALGFRHRQSPYSWEGARRYCFCRVGRRMEVSGKLWLPQTYADLESKDRLIDG